jgi:hypothetical protein
MERSPMEAVFKVCRSRNSGEAYRQFRSSALLRGLFAGAHEMAVGLLRHRLVGGAIALMGTVGLIGLLLTFWPH